MVGIHLSFSNFHVDGSIVHSLLTSSYTTPIFPSVSIMSSGASTDVFLQDSLPYVTSHLVTAWNPNSVLAFVSPICVKSGVVDICHSSVTGEKLMHIFHAALEIYVKTNNARTLICVWGADISF